MKRINFVAIALLLALFVVPAFVAVSAAPGEGLVEQSSEEVLEEGEEELGSTGRYVKDRQREMEDADDDTKEKRRAEIAERVQEKAMHAIQNAIRRYERVRTQVQDSNLTDLEKVNVVAKIDAQISSMNSLKIQVENAKTYDEVKNIMTQLKTRFKYSLGIVRQAIKGVHEDRLENVVEKISSAYSRISDKVEALEEGTTKTDLQVLLSQAQALIVSAETSVASGNYAQAKEDLSAAREYLHEIVESLTVLEG